MTPRRPLCHGQSSMFSLPRQYPRRNQSHYFAAARSSRKFWSRSFVACCITTICARSPALFAIVVHAPLFTKHSIFFIHVRLGVVLRALYVLAHILGQIHLVELRVIVENHGKFIRLVKLHGAFLQGKFQNMAPCFLSSEMKWKCQPGVFSPPI